MTQHPSSNPPLGSSPDQMLEQAFQFFRQGQDKDAEALCRTILKFQSDHSEAHYLLGLLNVRNREMTEGLAHFEAAIDKNPEHGPYWLAYIDILDQTGQTETARQVLEMARQAGLTGTESDILAARFEIQHNLPEPQTTATDDTSRTDIDSPDASTPDQRDLDTLFSLYQQNKTIDCENHAHFLLSHFPNHGIIWKVLGAVLYQEHRMEEAITAMRLATSLLPQDYEALNNLGITLKNTGNLAESESILRQAIALSEDFAEAHNNLGVTLMAQGRFTESEKCYRRALNLLPDYIEALCNLGICLKNQGRLAEAETSFRHALQLKPAYAEAWNNLGNLLKDMSRLIEAESCIRNALKLQLNFAIAWNNLGDILQCQGNSAESEQCYHQALSIQPDYTDAYDGLLFAANYHPDRSSEELFRLYRGYDERYGLPLIKQQQPHLNTRDTHRRLKIGYVSPAFYQHPVFHFLEPLLAHHDKNYFEIYAYSETLREDQTTICYKQYCDHWISTIGLTNEELTTRIRQDQIDILIDLAGHTGRNRLMVFAQKPAPVSLHWLDFGYTTGLTSIDYYLTDLSTAPLGSEHLFSEQLWRLPGPPFAYRPESTMGAVSPLPADRQGYITFGTLSRAIRINHRTIRVWSEILHRVDNARLVINSGNFKDQATQDVLREQFAKHGIAKNRLIIGYHSPPWDVLRGMDISLDCFPHNSGTTLFESLYMGVPFVSLADRPAIGRMGCSILEGAGHPEWVARSEEEYIEKAVALAADLPRLATIRNNLRRELEQSPLMDEQGFTRQIEDAYRQMFQRWCHLHPSMSKDSNDSLQPAPSNGKNLAIAFYNRGVELQVENRISEAKTQYIQAINLQNDFVLASNNLGVICQQEGKYEDAAACFLRTLALKPDYTDACYNLGNTRKLQHLLLDAERTYRQTLANQPNHVNALYNLGNILQEQGRPEEAELCLRQAIDLAPSHMDAFSTLLFTLNYSPDKDPQEIFQSYKEFNRRFFLPFQEAWQPHTNTSPENRRLKIGYVSPDYRNHPARYFLAPLLTHHDHHLVEIFAYVEVSAKEAAGDLFSGYAEHWHATRGQTDEELSERIRLDGIDILIDLAGHTANNRLGVFARKPAPVSLHWLDFGYTTGLTAIDYYLTDGISVPVGSDHLFSEKPWRLAPPALAYQPPEEAGLVNTLPSLENGFITFGSLTRAVRINHRTVRVWSAILKGCPGSRLIINSGSFREPGMRDALAARFQTHGIEKERLAIGCDSPPWGVLRTIDIGLDCFPHNSGTTLVESLYMGVPYITLADRPSVGRLGSSILEGISHPEWIAATEDEYIRKALILAADQGKLAALRAGFRREMEQSPLMDGPGFANKIEHAYQKMFTHWYKSKPVPIMINDKKNSRKATGKSKKNTPKQRVGNAFQQAAPLDTELNELAQLFNQGHLPEASLLARSLTTRFPHHGFGWKVLGPLLHQQGFQKEALVAMERAAICLPDDADTHYNLGIALQQAGLLTEAATSYERTLSLNKNHIQAKYNLGNILKEQGQLAKAENYYRDILKLKPDFFEVYCNLGNTLRAQGKLSESVSSYQSALKIKPDSAETFNNLGLTLRTQGLFPEAETACKQALKLNPDLPEANNNLGLIYQDQGRLTEAQAWYHRALEAHPHYAIAYNNLGNTFIKQGKLAEAENSLRKAIELLPNSANIYSDLLFLLNNHPDKSSEEIYEEYRIFNSRFGIPLQSEWKSFTNSHKTNRRLKVGYISSNFGKHSMRHFLEPLLAHHNKKKFEIYVYTDQIHEDEVTVRYKSYVDHWLKCTGVNDGTLTDQIRSDGIDILVDLAGHTGGNRLGVFSRKPAPVSLHWLDFGYTTGLTAIDYYLTDKTTVPEGSDDLFGETPWRIKTPCLAYRPAEGMGEVTSLPASQRGYITFGTLTRALRVNHRTITVWSKILQRVEGSHLVIDSSNFKDESVQLALVNKFVALGIDRNRLEIGYHSPPWDLLRDLDIGFDCFPHNSGTTLFEKLYLGIPFITLADRPCTGRLGSAILEGLGHPEWIAESEDEYIEKAVALASDLPKLAALREGLRQEMEQSPLMDEPFFASKVETAYKEMFKKWCHTEQTTPLQIENSSSTEKKFQSTATTSGKKPPRRDSTTRHPTKPHPDEIKKMVSLFHQGNLAGAATLARSLIERFPSDGFAWKVLGTVLQQQGQLDEALTVMQQASKLLETDAECHNNYAIIVYQKGLHNEAEIEFKRALKLNPRYAEAYLNLGDLLQHKGQYSDADFNYKQAIRVKKDYAEAYCNLAKSFIKQGRSAEAEDSCKNAIQIKPTFAEAYNCLGIALTDRDFYKEAEINYTKAIEYNPHYAEAYNNLGNSLLTQGLYSQAEVNFHLALQLKPNYAEGYSNLGNLHKEQGMLAKAEGSYLQALTLRPDSAAIHSNLLFLLNNHSDKTAEEIYTEYEKYNSLFGRPFQKEWQPFSNSRKTNRRLKVGYVSSKFSKHSTRHFLEPLLAHHDKTQIEIYVYTDLCNEDEVTGRYKLYTDHWLQSTGLSDAKLSERIRADQIDILVDLAGHTGGNRLGVFARKPAPVSLHWLDFGYTTGLTAIDYYLTDHSNVPEGSEGLFAEAPWRVTTPCLVYRPAEGMGEVSSLPALQRKHITFGTLTRALRINNRTIRVWSEILKNTKDAHLVIDSSNYKDPATQRALTEKFIAHGINPEQLEIGYTSPPWDLLRGIDIGLDCFPHNSGTTLIETLYMGAPFITLADRPSVGRLGSSILEGIGHPEWIAQTEEEYIKKAIALADNLPELATLRAGLRQEMEQSSLMDEPAFARKVETAYREMFMKWCEEQ